MKAYLGVVLVLLLGAIPAFGQHGTRLEAEIPFAFEMTGTALPAGTYEISLRTPVLVRNVERTSYGALTSPMAWSVPRDTKPDAKLVFNKYGDRHFLSQVWGPSTYYQLPKSRQERELVTSRLVAGLANPTTVVLAARIAK